MCTALEELKKEGIQEGITGVITILKEMGCPREMICEKIQKQYHLTKDEAMSYFHKQY